MFFKAWREKRKQKKLDAYADAYGHMDPKVVARLRQQQSPLRGRGSGRRG